MVFQINAFELVAVSFPITTRILVVGSQRVKQVNINQMFDKIQMILMMKPSISKKEPPIDDVPNKGEWVVK